MLRRNEDRVFSCLPPGSWGHLPAPVHVLLLHLPSRRHRGRGACDCPGGGVNDGDRIASPLGEWLVDLGVRVLESGLTERVRAREDEARGRL
jgi:hypothetical protein